MAYLKNNDSKSADKLIGKIDLKAAKNPFLYADVARYYLENGDLKQARKIAMEGISLNDTCMENYLVLIELARKENSSEAYYNYLLLTRSTDTAGVLEKELKVRGIEVKFVNKEEGLPNNKQAEENTADIPEQGKTPPNSQPNKQGESEQVASSSLNAVHPVSREEGMTLVKNLPEVNEYLAQNSLHKIVNWGDHQNKYGTLYYVYRVAFYRNDPKYPVDPTFGIYDVDSTNGQIYRTNGIPAIWSNGNWVESMNPSPLQ